MKATIGQIWEAASKEESRPVLMHVAFDAEKATLTATNSYIAARVPCEVEDGDESGLIPAIAIKEAKGRSLRIRDGLATLELDDGARSWRLLGDVTFPDVAKILDETPTTEIQYGVNPALLAQLASALGAGGKDHIPVALHPHHPLKGMLVSRRDGVSGVLMPVRLGDTAKMIAAHERGNLLDNDEAILAAVQAANAALGKRRGKRKAVEIFRKVLAEGAS